MNRLQIKSRPEFNEWTSLFDEVHGTQTLIGKMSINNVNLIFEPSFSVAARIDLILSEPFPDGDGEVMVAANETNYRLRQIMSLRQLYNEHVLTSPLSVSIFENGRAYIHPGRTRMMMGDVFPALFDVVVTYYRSNLHSDARTIFDAPLFKYDQVEMNNYNVAVIAHPYNEPNTMGTQFWDIVATNTSTPSTLTYKETYGHEDVEHRFREITEPMFLEKSNNIVYVDGMPLFERIDGNWMITKKQNG